MSSSWRAGDALPLVDHFYAAFGPILSLPPERLAAVGGAEALPAFAEPDLIALCRVACSRFMHQPPLIRVDVPIAIVGDIHGSFRDLVRLLRHFGPTARYLFLGDYVDRGEFSIECITLLFAFTCKFPARVFLLRGNHEFEAVCADYGFKHDVLAAYTRAVFEAFMGAFSFMPLAAVLNGNIFCVHGGIGPSLASIGDLERLARPIVADEDDLLVRSLLWADPVNQNVRYGPATRSEVPTYGVIAVREFLRANALKMIIRAHQCVNGVQADAGFPVITVFSASNYRIRVPNDSGAVSIDWGGNLAMLTFPPIERMPRENASFFSVGESKARGEIAAPPVPSSVVRPGVVSGFRRANRTLTQNSVTALILPRTALTSTRLITQAASSSSALQLQLGLF